MIAWLTTTATGNAENNFQNYVIIDSDIDY